MPYGAAKSDAEILSGIFIASLRACLPDGPTVHPRGPNTAVQGGFWRSQATALDDTKTISAAGNPIRHRRLTYSFPKSSAGGI
jgi:hypothetical protein